jgi:peptidoglycan/xylan/chitin deacetylase (PgdA/CDA1 family)
LKRKAKIAISVVFHIITIGVALVSRAVGRPISPRLIILYYHAVPSVLRQSFARQLDMLVQRAKVVPAEYHEAVSATAHNVAITFDDAFVSVIENALPELRARNLPATVFVPAGSLGRQPFWEIEDSSTDAGEVIASAEILRGLPSHLVNLGAHSLTHPRLSQIPTEEARREIAGSGELMRDLFGINVRTFAFPYGDYNTATVELCRDAGYERVFTIVPCPVDPASGEFVRGRTAVHPSDGRLEFYLKMSGAYAWMRHASAAKQWLKGLLTRREKTRS